MRFADASSSTSLEETCQTLEACTLSRFNNLGSLACRGLAPQVSFITWIGRIQSLLATTESILTLSIRMKHSSQSAPADYKKLLWV